MASTKTKRRRKSKRSTPLVSSGRKQEILGLILMVGAFLLSLALLSYHASDGDLARSFSFLDLRPARSEASNWLGLVGAWIAQHMVPNFLGYTALLLTGLVGVWGYVIFRHRQTVYLPLISLLTFVGAFMLAALFGWLGIALEQDWILWSGALGQGIAGWMRQVFGAVGSLVLLLLMLVVTVLLVIDHDVQRSMDRVEDLFRLLRDRFRAWNEAQHERRLERREERARLREERQKQREEQRAEGKKKRAAASSTRKAHAPPSRTKPPSAPSRPVATETASRSGATINDQFSNRQTNGSSTRAEPPRPAQPPAPKPTAQDASAASSSQPEIELKVRQRVEEEKADDIERDTDVVDEEIHYAFPPVDLLDQPEEGEIKVDYDELEENKRILLDKLATYNIDIVDINAVVGPTVTLYELIPAPGVKISRITSLEDDLAMAMAARGIRMIAPIPGKSAIGVEIPNRHRELVRLRDIIGTAKFRDAQMELPVALGKSIEGEVFLSDLTKMPHLLIAGATGSGKSVGLNALIAGLLYACHPSNLKFVMIDPKKIELQQYRELMDHYLAIPEDGDDAIITDFHDALGVLKACEKEMERRYDLLSQASVRSIRDYNKKLQQGKLSTSEKHEHLPYVVVIVDELADLMMTAGKDIEGPIARLAQMARAVGIHLVLATQRPSVDVITGLIKANFPSRVAYQVASKIDARTILDQNGAEGLVGNGDLLYMNGSHLIRLQGPYVSVDEVDRLMEFIGDQPGKGSYVLPPAEEDNSDPLADALGVDETDDLFEEAARIIVRSQQGSVSLLQRKLSVGYTRAARIVDQLEEAGIVGPFVGSKARDVLVADEQQLDELFDARTNESE